MGKKKKGSVKFKEDGKSNKAKHRGGDGDHSKKRAAPKPGEKKTAQYKGGHGNWHWCGKDTGGSKCEKWRAHDPSECMGIAECGTNNRKTTATATRNDQRSKSTAAKKLKVARAYVAKLEQQASSGDDSDEVE